MAGAVGLVFLSGTGDLPGFAPGQLERLRGGAGGLEWLDCATREEFVARLPEASAALTWEFKPEWGDAAKNLRFVSTPSAGKELVSVHPHPGLEVSFGSFHGPLMAETVLGMMLAFVRGIKDCLERPADPWPRGEMRGRAGHLRGSHAVILGFGHIGKWVGRLLKPFGARITGVNRSNLERPDYFRDGDRVAALDALDGILPLADHLILALPGDSGTDGVMDGRRLALLRPDAYIYNIGRGNAIDLPALVAALKASRLAGAGLDVFPQEPLPADSPAVGCPRMIRLPHMSAFGPLYMDMYLDELLPEIGKRFGRR